MESKFFNNTHEEFLIIIKESNYGMDKIVLLKGENLNNELEEIIKKTLTFYNYDDTYNDYINYKETIKDILNNEFEIIDMNNIKLTSENMEDLAEYIIKKEMLGKPLMYDVDYNDELSKEEFENIYSKVDNKYLYYAIEDHINDMCYDNAIEQRNELTKYILNKYGDKEELQQNYDELFENLTDIGYNTVEYVIPVNKILSQTKVDEITFYLKGKNEDIEDTIYHNESFVTEDLEELRDILEYEEFNSITYLIQTQGYEVKDLFDNKKVETSKFLTSLKKNLDYCIKIGLDTMTPTFTYTNNNLKEVLDYINEDTRSVIINKDGCLVTLTDPFGFGTSYFNIELEKDVHISKDNVVMYSSYLNEGVVGLENITDGFESKGNVILSNKEISNIMKENDCRFIDELLEKQENERY